ncbi:DUF2156 domain-containing protein [Candidatus Margulisiibacteriota bacterium]
MSIPKFPNFKLLELADKKEILSWLNKYPQTMCEMNFLFLFLWQHSNNHKLTIINNNLIIHVNSPIYPPYSYYPIGDHEIINTIEQCLTFSRCISCVSEQNVKKYFSNNNTFKVVEDIKNHDYIYLTNDLIRLEGKKYDGKRNHIKRFKKNNSYIYKKLEKKDQEKCIQILKLWQNKNTNLDKLTIESQRDALATLFDNFNNLNMHGGVLIVNNKIEAFSIASPISNEMVTIHFEIGNPELKGIFTTLTHELAKNELSRFKYINREQDLGLPGLRKSKLSWNPHHLERKFDLTAVRQV